MARALWATGEAKRSTNTLTTTKRYDLMTINMNGNGKPSERRALSSKIVKHGDPSVVFCQELPDRFIKDVVEKCDTCDYDFVRTAGKEAAVMWNKEDFYGEPVDAALKTKILDSLVASHKIDNDSVSEIPTRTAVVTLSSKEDACDCRYAFLAVSWHGPHSRMKMDKKKMVVKALILFLSEACRWTDASSFIIGGDFNLNTLKDIGEDADLKGLNVLFSHYELSPRGKLAIEIKGRGRPYIPYKDNFAVASISLFGSRPLGGREVSQARYPFSYAKEEEYRKARKEKFETGSLSVFATDLPFTSRPFGDREESQARYPFSYAKGEEYRKIRKEKFEPGRLPVVADLPFTNRPYGDREESQARYPFSYAKGEEHRKTRKEKFEPGRLPVVADLPFPNRPFGDREESQARYPFSYAKGEEYRKTRKEKFEPGRLPVVGDLPFPNRPLGHIEVSQVRALSLDVKVEEKSAKVGNDLLDHDPITGVLQLVLQHGSSCIAPISGEDPHQFPPFYRNW